MQTLSMVLVDFARVMEFTDAEQGMHWALFDPGSRLVDNGRDSAD
jgi:hypothetical protein